MTFRLTIETDNAAFEGDNCATEIARLLRRAAARIEAGVGAGPISDSNGNRVGSFEGADPNEDEEDAA